MHLLAVCLFYLSVRCSVSDEASDQLWENYKTEFNKTYDDPVAEKEARTNFELNMISNVNHNMQGDANYTKEVHAYSDLHPAVMIEKLCGTEVPLDADNKTRQNFLVSERLAHSSWDWVEQGKVSSVKDQGNCGSCWAFAAAQAIESTDAILRPPTMESSVQALIDCDTGNGGCGGGWPANAYKYVMKNKLPSAWKYPYTGEDQTCKEPVGSYYFRLSDYGVVGPAGDENALADALSKKGPLSVSIYVTPDFMHYSGGIYHDDKCNNLGHNHAVLLVGYGTEGGVDFWKIKNSWGTSWGEGGYMRMQRNRNNMCMIAQYASYPISM